MKKNLVPLAQAPVALQCLHVSYCFILYIYQILKLLWFFYKKCGRSEAIGYLKPNVATKWKRAAKNLHFDVS